MAWTVLEHPEFAKERVGLPSPVLRKLAQAILSLIESGPALGRPLVDTLNGSRHRNMKELRFFEGDGVWRFVFAFDPRRNAVILVGGDKSGISQERFYDRLISIADRRFDNWNAGR